jgi:nitrite reductase (NADH) small subunit
MPKSYLVARRSEIEEGGRRVVSCDGTEIGVFQIHGKLVAWHNECPHRSGPICQGRIYKRVVEPLDEEGKVRSLAFEEGSANIVCTWHGYEYDLATGVNQGHDKLRLRAAKLEEKDGNVYVIL